MSRKNILTHSVPLFLRSSVLCCGREQSLWNLSFKENPSFSIQPSGLGIKSWKAGSSTPARTGAEHEPKSHRRAGQGPTRLSGQFDKDGRYLQKFCPRCLAAARTRWPKHWLPSPLPAPRTTARLRQVSPGAGRADLQAAASHRPGPLSQGSHRPASWKDLPCVWRKWIPFTSWEMEGRFRSYFLSTEKEERCGGHH